MDYCDDRPRCAGSLKSADNAAGLLICPLRLIPKELPPRCCDTSADKSSLQRLRYFSSSPKEDGATSTGKVNRERVTTRVYQECRQHLVTQIMYESLRPCQCVCVCVCIICKVRLSDDDVRRSGAHITPRLLSYNLVARTVPWARFPRFIADRTLPLSTVPVPLQVT